MFLEMLLLQNFMTAQNDFQIQKYEHVDRDAVLELFGNPPFKSAIFDWQFSRRNNYHPVLLRHGPRVVAFNGVMPVRISIRGSLLEAAWSCDFYVDRDYRRRGLGKLLKSALYRQGNCFMALGVSESGAAVLPKLGWKNCASTRRYVRIRQADDLFRKGIRTFQDAVALVFSPLSRRVGRCLTTTISDCLPDIEVLDQLWGRCQRAKATIVCRDADYLKWRYEQMPIKGYKFIQANHNEDPVFLLVCRTTSDSLDIVDYIGDLRNSNVLMAAVDSALSRANGLRTVQCRVSISRLSIALLLRGFLPARQRSKLFVKAHDEVSGYMLRKWFLIGGDSDCEILRAAEEQQSLRDSRRNSCDRGKSEVKSL